ncbi:MAG: protein-arginine deiminase family protein [Ignavibacteriota bacterium]
MRRWPAESCSNTVRAFPDGRESFELWVHSRRFLDRGQGILLDTLDLSQAILDDVRTTLINDLGFQDGDIIEVPALLNIETGACVAMTGDSVNLLQKVGGALQASQCLVPKPFGPVYAGEYVFENHLQTQFNALGIQAQYCADDRYHLDEGELHCATNQTHPALTGDLQKWYEWVAP